MPEPITPQEEIRRLVEFTEQLQWVLATIVARPHYIVPGRHHELLAAAWYEVLPAFTELRGLLTTDSRPKLNAVGLTGFRLQFELAVFAHARDQLLDYAPELFGAAVELPLRPSPTTIPSIYVPTPQKKRRSWWRRLGRRIVGCFKAGDVVLGSLGKVFPPAEIITQFKEGVEEGISLARTFADTA